MLFASRTIITTIVFFIIIVVGGIWLQIFLSTKEGKWPGLILPIISFGLSLLAVLGVVLFSAHTGAATLIQDGEVVEEVVEVITEPVSILVSAVYIFALQNIPTAILLAIYAACRGKQSRQRALEKMSIQDLE